MPDGLMGLEDSYGDQKGSPEYVHNIATIVTTYNLFHCVV